MPDAPVRFLDAGDTAFTVEFGNAIDAALLQRVGQLHGRLEALREAGQLDGVLDLVPTFRSLGVIYDPLQTSRRSLQALVEAQLAETGAAPRTAGRCWRLPVLYGGEHGPDLAEVAERCGLSPDEVVARHSATEFRVYMLGFLPGFAFMGDLPESLRLPRRREPRVRVPAGSVAIATGLSAIYPWESPGGWHLLGRCPLPLFSPAWPTPALLAAGDRVRLQAVDAARYQAIEAALRNAPFDPLAWQEAP